MGARRKAREYALQALYLADITPLPPEKALKGILTSDKIEERIRTYTKWLTEGTLKHKPEIDELITKVATNWEIDRMAALDRNILRMGAFELLYENDTPPSVIIDEAVEIAKTFSTIDSGKFVNGILDKIKLERKSETVT
ncbi:MAG: transcription antitermination factor NusB [Elusimicrobia bacterium]|nr:transcription antitermination factor NusB [Candidatus Obscuribacterium magneticum]